MGETIIQNATKRQINIQRGFGNKPCKRCGLYFVEGDDIVMKKNRARHYHLKCWESILQ